MRKFLKLVIISLTLFCFLEISPVFSWAEKDNGNIAENEKTDQKLLSQTSDNTFFSVSTDDESAVESLNRVSGEIDRGFSSSDQAYTSSHPHSPDPFARSEEISRKNNPYS